MVVAAELAVGVAGDQFQQAGLLDLAGPLGLAEELAGESSASGG